MLKQLHDSLWEMERPLKVPGLRMGHRMTVVNGDLWVHSPVAFDDALASELIALGSLAHFVTPSRYHDLHWPEWFRRFPKATFYCSPGVKEEHPELPFQRVLSTATPEAWESELPKLLIRGMPKLNEVVSLHRASRTLIVADLVFNFDVGQQHLVGRLFLKLNGIYGRIGCSRILRRLVKDRQAFGSSINRLLQLDFDRLVPGQGRASYRSIADLLTQHCRTWHYPEWRARHVVG